MSTFSETVDFELLRFRVEHLGQSAGTRNALIGSLLENIILMANQVYESRGLGVVKKNNVEVKSHAGRVFRKGKQTVDFDGYLKGIGFVAFDAKSTESNEWRPPHEQLHQFLFLYRGQREMSRGHARFFYILERRQHPIRWYLVEDLELIKRTGKYIFNEKDRMPNGPGLLFDYYRHLQVNA